MPVQNARQILTQALQRLGYALLLPVSILPLAALLYRLGQPDVLDLAVLSSPTAPCSARCRSSMRWPSPSG